MHIVHCALYCILAIPRHPPSAAKVGRTSATRPGLGWLHKAAPTASLLRLGCGTERLCSPSGAPNPRLHVHQRNHKRTTRHSPENESFCRLLPFFWSFSLSLPPFALPICQLSVSHTAKSDWTTTTITLHRITPHYDVATNQSHTFLAPLPPFPLLFSLRYIYIYIHIS